MQRAADIRDINSSLYSKLTNNSLTNLSRLPDGSVLVISELTPSMAVDIDPAKTRGIIAETGGYTSHSAILARALGIPCLLYTSIPKGILNVLGCFNIIFVNQSRYDILLSFCQWLYVINFFLLPCHNKTSYGT